MVVNTETHTGQCAERETGMLSPKGDTDTTGITTEERAAHYSEAVFSGHNRPVAQMNSQLGWLQDAQDQARQNPSMGVRVGQEIPPLAEKLLASDGCWEESQFSSGMWLIGYPYSSSQPYTHAHPGNPKWTH